MAHAKAVIETAHYATAIDAGGHRIVADEPPANGGADAGPAPYDLLLAALSACTAITLKMYADRKQWPLTRATVELHFTRDAEKNEKIDRVLHLEGDLSEEQRARFGAIAERTPVTLTLKRGLPILTTLAPAGR
ncbi:MAG: OsmC family protein [Proteobacteria bacterium]|nr:OsmC family protein [Pseudomonadota bacterium]